MLDLEEHIKECAADVVAVSFGIHQDDYLKYRNYQNLILQYMCSSICIRKGSISIPTAPFDILYYSDASSNTSSSTPSSTASSIGSSSPSVSST